MDKPISMAVKDYLMRVYSVRNNIPLKTIEAVVDHQFEEARKALKDNHSVEISGFGKFILNERKIVKLMEKNLSKKALFENKLTLHDLTEEKRKSWTNKLNNTITYIENLKPILDGFKKTKSDPGRVEEQIDSTRGTENCDTGSSTGEEENM